MKKKNFIILAVSIVLLTALYLVLKPKITIAPVQIQEQPVSSIKVESNITVDPSDKNLLTYTSPNLGIQFSFLKDGGIGDGREIKVFEKGNEIYFTEGGVKTDSITVFKKKETETIDAALHRLVPKQFTNKYCSVVNLKKNEYLIWDKRIPVSYFRATTLDGSPYQDLKDVACLPVLPFTTETDFNTIYYVDHPTQAPSYLADEAHTREWWQTIQVIKNKFEVEGNKESLVSFSLTPGQEVSGQMEVSGVIKGGYFFEGSMPMVILDTNKNVTHVGPGYVTATTDWMTAGPVSFKTTIDFGLIPKGNAYIKFTQDDPSGGESGMSVQSVLIPIIIK